MRVELDIFSGRPNPTWEMTAAQAETLTSILREMPTHVGQIPFNDGLGYRGFIIRDSPDFDIALAYKGCVSIERKNQKLAISSGERILDHWLLENTRPYIASEVYQLVLTEIDT
ncbi:MAG: hypothetical protein SF123_08405 [Chloroflexota bacterium]|nr:hypothetical protein [Chloroflexota bacterium]